MRKLTLFIFMLSTICLTAQTNKEVLNLIQIANDSIENGQIEGAKRILEGLSVYDSFTDTIQILNKKMTKKSLSLAYEAYTNRQFDLAQQYYYAVTDSDDVRPYWIDNASKMDFAAQIVGFVLLSQIESHISKIIEDTQKQNKTIRKVNIEQYKAFLIKIAGTSKNSDNIVNYMTPFYNSDTGKWGFKDLKGVVLIPAVYDEEPTDFIGQYSVVKKNGIYGFVHESGSSVFDDTCKDIMNYDGNNEYTEYTIIPDSQLYDNFRKIQHNLVEEANLSNRTFTVNGVSFTMIHVPGGTFTMGATSEQDDFVSWEKPEHEVKITSSFFISQTEVTQELWETVMGGNPSKFKGSKRPVENVSWEDCQDFIIKLNNLTGRQFRLPTEAEWEYAARGGKSGGTQYSGSEYIDSVACYRNTKGTMSLTVNWKKELDRQIDRVFEKTGTFEVATKQPNSLGIYDMSGNVYEWCQDWFGKDYYLNSPYIDPKGPETSDVSLRVVRGGSWDDPPKFCRVSLRQGCEPNKSPGGKIGLRLALSQL